MNPERSARLTPQQWCVLVALLRFVAALGFCFAIIVASAPPSNSRVQAAQSIRTETSARANGAPTVATQAHVAVTEQAARVPAGCGREFC